MKFEELWEYLQISLQVGDEIPHWSVSEKYDKTEFTIVEMSDFEIKIKTSKNANVSIPRKDFETIFNNWDEYLKKKVLRKELRDIPNRNTTYVISILHKIGL